MPSKVSVLFCLVCFSSLAALTCWSLANETVLVCQLSPGSGARTLCNKQEQLPEPPASHLEAGLPRKPGTETAGSIQRGGSHWRATGEDSQVGSPPLT